ncbi:MAG: hypothetical protein K9L56_14045, partial [Clostridiales bacterium]|nr:hypothetical protein [Clostridiales bacterium]
MTIQQMYSSKVNSPVTTLTTSLNDNVAGTVETVDVSDATALPSAPGIATIGTGPTAETIKYTDITGSTLTIERGFEGPTSVWTSGTPIGRFFTSYDHETFKGNIESLDAEVNSPAPTPVTITESIQSLSTGIVDGNVDNLEINGLTLVNSAGNFENTSDFNALYTSSFTITNNEVELVGDGSNNEIRLLGDLDDFVVQNGNKYFISVDAKLSANVDFITLQLRKSYQTSPIIGAMKKTEIAVNSYETYTAIIDSTVDARDIDFNVIIGYADTTSQNSDIVYLKNRNTTFLSSLGLESLTESQMLDLVRSGYIDGIQSMYRPKIECVGKNLFDKNEITPNTKFQGDADITNITDNSFLSDYIKVKANQTYIISPHINDSRGFVALFDMQKNVLGDATITDDFTPTVDGYVRFGGYNFNLEDTQLEEGSTETEFENFKSSQITADVNLRHLPNGVQDKVYEDNGEVWLEKNVEEYTLQSADIIKFSTSKTNFDYVQFNNPVGFIDDITKNMILPGFTQTLSSTLFDSDSADYVGKFDNVVSISYITLGVQKGTYANLAEAQADLAGTVIQYQLETPELINLTTEGLVDGELQTYENGTIYNTSDTFNSVDVSFDAPTNRADQIAGLIESVNQVNNRIDPLIKTIDIVDKTLAPGSETLIKGDRKAGFFGYVSSSELITGDDLALDLGLTAGTSMFSDTQWIKYIFQDEIKFVPVKPFRHSISWNSIYNVGAVYGTEDEGTLPPNGRLGVQLSILASDNSINTTGDFLNTDAVIGAVGETLKLTGWS